MRTIKDPAVRKAEIIEAATGLFIDQGYEKTTVESIIAKAGVAKGGFYYYFQSKDEVFEACIAGLTRTILNAYDRILTNEQKSAKARLLEYVEYNFRLAGQERAADLSRTIHSGAFESIHTRIMRESVRQVMPAFVRLIGQGRADGDFHVEDAGFTAAALLGAFQELHGMSLPGMDPGRQRELVLDLMERLLQTDFLNAKSGRTPEPEVPTKKGDVIE